MSNIPIFGTLSPSSGSPLPIIDGGGNKLVNVATPTVSTDVATKGYVDAVAQGLDVKGHVTALYDSNITLSGAPVATSDGVTPTTGQTVLVINQSSGIQDGPWVSASGAWTRPANYANGSHGGSGYFFVQQGSKYGDTGWVCSTDAPNDVVGTNALAFVQFSAAGIVIADEVTLTKSGNTMSVKAGGLGDTQIAGLSPSKLLQAAAAVGMALIWGGSSWAPGTNFGAQNLVTTGTVSIGTTPAGAGALRLASAASINSRNNGNTADLNVYLSNSSDSQVYGSSASLTTTYQAGTELFLALANGNVLGFVGSQVQLALSGVVFQANQTGTFGTLATNVANATGLLLTFSGQDTVGTGTTTGGKVLLRSGTGTTPGDFQISQGNTSALLFSGGVADFNGNNLHTTGNLDLNVNTAHIRIGLVAGSGMGGISAASVGNLRVCEGFIWNGRLPTDAGDALIMDFGATQPQTLTIGDISHTVVNINSAGIATFNAVGGIVEWGTANFTWGGTLTTVLLNPSVSNFSIGHLLRTVPSAVGAEFDLVGMDCSGSGSTGGKVLVRSGQGPAFASDGALVFQIGTTTVFNGNPSAGTLTYGSGTMAMLYNADNTVTFNHQFQLAGTTVFEIGLSGLQTTLSALTFVSTSVTIGFNTAPGTFTSGTMAGLTIAAQGGGASTGTYKAGTTVIRGGDVAGGGSATASGGDIAIRGGNGGVSSLNGNISLGTFASSFQGGSGIIFIANDTADPTAAPSGGGFLYVKAGALRYRGSSNTDVQLAAA